MPGKTLDDAGIRGLATAASYERGRTYHDDGAVSSLARRGDTITAEVAGSGGGAYRVTVRIADGRIAEARCTCPYEWGGACKHVVATLLTFVEEAGAVVERPALDALLGWLDRPALMALLSRRAAIDPGLAGWIEAEIAAMPGSGRPPDPGPVADHARAVLAGRYRARDYWDGYRASGNLEELRDLVAKAVPLMESGDGRGALRVLEAVTEAFVDEWIEEASGTDEHLYDLFADLGRMMAEAALMSDLDAGEREALAVSADDWDDRLADYGVEGAFALAAYALRRGWDASELQAVLAGEGGTWPPDGAPEAGDAEDDATDEEDDRLLRDEEAPEAGLWLEQMLSEVRLRVLDAAGRHEAYLHLARATGNHVAGALMLTRLGRVEEALAQAQATFTRPGESLELAQALERADRTEAAFGIAEAGLALGSSAGEPYRPGRSPAPLARWLREAAGAAGRTDLALKAARAAFAETFAREDFHAARAPAGPDWEPVRRDLLAALLTAERAADRVEILLDEGLVDEAVGRVGADSAYGTRDAVLLRLLEAAHASHPDWVIRVALRKADAIMDQGFAGQYAEAAEWMRHASLAYDAAGRIDGWSTALEQRIARHRRKYKLRPLLEALRFDR